MLPTVPYTKARGATYHYNIPIPKEIQHLYPAKSKGAFKRIFDGTMKTSDARQAADLVADQRARMRQQLRAVQHASEQARIAQTLDPEDKKLLATVGGVDGLLKALKDLRNESAFLVGSAGDPHAPEVEGGYETAPYVVLRGGPALDYSADITHRAEEQEVNARIQALTSEVRRLKTIAGELGVDTPAAPRGMDEGGEGAREIAESFCDAFGYTTQNRDAVRNTVRRWLELHGDMPVRKWTRAHIKAFHEALKRLPSTVRADIRGMTILDAAQAAEQEGLAVISAKTRKRYCDHMKGLSKYALNTLGLIDADPFAGFQPTKEKVKHSKTRETDRVAYTPEQVGMILDHCATFDPQTMDRWLPLIAAYTGMRREEIGQLTVDDIRLVGNMHVIDITDGGPGQKIKNKHSLRLVPIPSPIIDAGFISYWQQRKADGAFYLFQQNYRDRRTKKVELREVEPDSHGRFTERYGRNFPATVRKPLGLVAPGMSFHSLRHSWTDAARRAGVDDEIRRKIAGRLDNGDTVEAGYGDDPLLAQKLAVLEAIAREVRK